MCRNALIPIVTVAALNVGGLLGGAIVTETVFGLDGIGFYFVQKLGQQDVYAVMAYLLVTSAIVIRSPGSMRMRYRRIFPAV